jgi:hypothetical protein
LERASKQARTLCVHITNWLARAQHTQTHTCAAPSTCRRCRLLKPRRAARPWSLKPLHSRAMSTDRPAQGRSDRASMSPQERSTTSATDGKHAHSGWPWPLMLPATRRVTARSGSWARPSASSSRPLQHSSSDRSGSLHRKRSCVGPSAKGSASFCRPNSSDTFCDGGTGSSSSRHVVVGW